MVYPAENGERQFDIYMALSQYPVLSEKIRARMRRELYERGIITPQQFESEARIISIQSQELEGLRNPYGEEPAEVWEYRLARVREVHTDKIFSRFLILKQMEKNVDQAVLIVFDQLRKRSFIAGLGAQHQLHIRVVFVAGGIG